MARTISIVNLQKTVPLSPAPIIKAAKKILQAEGIQRAELSIVFVDDAAIRTLNRRYLKRGYTTDVLSFDLSGAETAEGKLQGEIIISAPTAAKNAKKFGTSMKRELLLYVIHGILHLTGYDDHVPADIRRMRKREEELLKLL